MQKMLDKPDRSKQSVFRLTPMAVQKIAAVEGIDLTGDVQSEFDEFDRLGSTPEQRIAAIKAKYGKPLA